MTVTKAQLRKAEQAFERARFRLQYLQDIRHFRKISVEHCVAKKLCTATAEGGRLHCGYPAYVTYKGTYHQCYLCWSHYVSLTDRPEGMEITVL